MKKLSLALAIIIGTWSIQSCTEGRGNSNATKTKVDINGLTFIKNAHEGNLIEIAASKLAKQKSTNSEITAFADMMIADHGKISADVDTLAAAKFVSIRDTVNADDKIVLDSLAKKTGADFDKAYVQMMLAGHKDAEELFSENETSNYTEIRDVVEKCLPTIKKHLEEVKKLAASVK